jgi:hypothetical protein
LFVLWRNRRWGISAAVRRVILFAQGGIVIAMEAVVRRTSRNVNGSRVPRGSRPPGCRGNNRSALGRWRVGHGLVKAREGLPAGARHAIPAKATSSGLKQVVMFDVKLWRGQASLHAEHERDAASMSGGDAEVDTHTSACQPGRERLSLLQRRGKNVHRAPEGVVMANFSGDASSSEELVRGSILVVAFQGRCIVKDLASRTKSIRPQASGSSLRPVMRGMKNHGTGLFAEVPNAAFGNAILPMGIDSAVSNALVFLSKSLLPRIVHKSAIVCVVVSDAYAAITSKELKSILGFKSLQGGGVLLQVNIADTAVVVHKDGGNAVATSSEASL